MRSFEDSIGTCLTQGWAGAFALDFLAEESSASQFIFCHIESMSGNEDIKIEGYTAEELLNLTELEVEQFVFNNQPIAFKVGSAEILGQFNVSMETLVVELAHIDGGGEGILTVVWSLARRFAMKLRLRKIEWIVDAVHCAKPI